LRGRTHSLPLRPSSSPDRVFTQRWQNVKIGKHDVADSRLARLNQEIAAPTGQVAFVFTDVENITLLWDTYPTAMNSAMNMHNELIRRQLRNIGGYEVKMNGGTVIAVFPTATSAHF
jgi:adenylate cyclase